MRALPLLVLLAACGGHSNCPVSIPADGSSCETRGLACESGGGPHQRCSTFFTCSDALDPSKPTSLAWVVKAPGACNQQNDAACPVDFNTAPVAKACPTEGLSCDYPEGRCDCAACNPSGLNWRCRGWNDSSLGASCPADRPALGSDCDVNGVTCNYDDQCEVSFGPDMVCFDGKWQPRNGLPRTCGTPVCGVNS